MPSLIELPTISDPRGSLTVLEKVLPFPVQRVFFIHDVSAPRGGHGHKVTRMALIATGGKVRVLVQSPDRDSEFLLTSPNQCLVLEPQDWHTMDQFDPNTTLVVLASHPYDKNDYFFEKYR